MDSQMKYMLDASLVLEKSKEEMQFKLFEEQMTY